MPGTKLDLRRALKKYYSPPVGDVELVKLPPLRCIMVDGDGNPNGKPFQEAMGVVYNMAYTMKFRSKKQLKKDYTVMAPEGLWWMKGGKIDLTKPGNWLWTLLMVVPDFVTPKLFSDTMEEVRQKKNPPGLDKAHLETLNEGLCVQTLHIGPYSAETESISRMEAFAKNHGFKLVGKHHEIYLGDPRRSAPSKLRTILRHSVAEV